MTGYDIRNVMNRTYGLSQRDGDVPIVTTDSHLISSLLRRIALYVAGRKEA